jgi:hypothetical protein
LKEERKTSPLFGRTREYIDDYFPDSTMPFDSRLLPDPSSEFVTLLLADAGADYLDLLPAIETVSTRWSILSSALKLFREGEGFDVDPTILQRGSAHELVGRIQRDRNVQIAEVGRGASACPSCRMSLSSVTQELHRDMIVSCPSCPTILIRTRS